MNQITEKILKLVSDYNGKFEGAFNIREDGCCVGRQSSDHIKIETKKDKPGLDIKIKAGTKGETVSIPACVTHGDQDDLVYNDFYVGKNAKVKIVAGCGVHTTNGEPARHNGIHRFFIEEGAHVTYIEKHIGIGLGEGLRVIDPVTEAEVGPNAVLEMDTAQIGGVDRTRRKLKAKLEDGARLLVRERIMTEKDQYAKTEFEVELKGIDSGTDLVSRSVARNQSHQEYESKIIGLNRCIGHSECDAIIAEDAYVDASPNLCAHHSDAALIHEAAIGKIAGEQITKLMTLGLTEKEAEEEIIKAFLS